MFEIFTYSHQGNGNFGIFKLNGKDFEIIAGGSTSRFHDSTWDEMRQTPLLDGIGLEQGELFDCVYSGHGFNPSFNRGRCLEIRYEDENKDGNVDIILSGRFRCETSTGRVLLSQDVERVYVYDKIQSKYVLNLDMSIRSPLEEYWHPNVVLWIEEGR